MRLRPPGTPRTAKKSGATTFPVQGADSVGDREHALVVGFRRVHHPPRRSRSRIRLRDPAGVRGVMAWCFIRGSVRHAALRTWEDDAPTPGAAKALESIRGRP